MVHRHPGGQGMTTYEMLDIGLSCAIIALLLIDWLDEDE